MATNTPNLGLYKKESADKNDTFNIQTMLNDNWDKIDTAVIAKFLEAKGYADSKITQLVNAAPGALDTLKELSDALGDDPNFRTTIINMISEKAPAGYGLGTIANRLSAGTDLNIITANGWYDVSSPLNGVPGLSWHSVLVVCSADINFVTQYAYPMTDDTPNTAYMRQKRAGNWTAWKQIATTDLIPTSLPANGGNANTVGGKSPSDFAPSGYGLGDVAREISNTDLNNIATTGFYRGHDCPNAPTAEWIYLIVVSHDEQWLSQIAIHFVTGTTWTRVKNSGNWAGWQQTAIASQIPTNYMRTDTNTATTGNLTIGGITNAQGGFTWNGESLDNRYITRYYKTEQKIAKPYSDPSSGNLVFLELKQEDSDGTHALVNPSIRFHHEGRFWDRIEARGDGFHFKDGNIAQDIYLDATARTLKALQGIEINGQSLDDRYLNSHKERVHDIDCNAFVTEGIYAIGLIATNGPSAGIAGGSWGNLIVTQSGDVICQLLLALDSTLFYRIFTAGSGWLPWKEIASVDQMPTTLPANGGNSATVGGYSPSNLIRSTDEVFVGDWNNLRSTGMYMINGLAGSINHPVDAYGWGTLIIFRGSRVDASGISQMYIAHSNSEIWVRSGFETGNWTDWTKVAKTSDIPTSLPASGGDSATVGGKYATDFAPSGYGLGSIEPVINGVDLNTIRKTGFYSGYNITNAPAIVGGGWLFLIHRQSTQGDVLTQTAWDSSGYMHIRNSADYGATWTVWEKHAKVSDIPTTLPASGGNADTVGGYSPSAFAPSGYGLGNTPVNISNSDLDTLLANGFFIGMNLAHSPTNDTEWFYVISQRHTTTDWCSQIAIEYGALHNTLGNRMYTRVKKEDVWTAWKQIATTDDIPTSLPANGGNSNTVGGYGVGLSWVGNAFGFIPRVAEDGVIDIGKYIDFHDVSGDGVDFTNRLYSAGVGVLKINDDDNVILTTKNRYNGGYATSYTENLYAGYWTKIASVSLTAQYVEGNTTLLLSSAGHGGGSKTSGTLVFRAKQQSPMGTAPYVDLQLAHHQNIDISNFKAVIVVNDAGQTLVELYYKAWTSFDTLFFLPIMQTPNNINFYNYQPYISSLPSGTQIDCGYLKSLDKSIYVADANNHFSTSTLDGVLDELFQSASNVKISVSNAIGSPSTSSETGTQLAQHILDSKNNLATNLNNKGVSASGDETLNNLTAKVANIARGQGTAVESQVLSGVPFSNQDGQLRYGNIPVHNSGEAFGSAGSDAFYNSPITGYAWNDYVGAFDFPLSGYFNGSYRLHIPNLLPQNIKAGVTIGKSGASVTGTYNKIYGVGDVLDKSKIQSNLGQVWEQGIVYTVDNLRFDPLNGDIYATYGGILGKFDLNGNIIWSVFLTGNATALAIGSDGYIYTGTDASAVRRHNPSNGGYTFEYIEPGGGSITGIGADVPNGAVVYCTSTGRIRRLWTAGTSNWYYDKFTQTATALDIDPWGNVFIAGQKLDGTVQILKMSATGSTQFTYVSSAIVGELSVDSRGDVYCILFGGLLKRLNSIIDTVLWTNSTVSSSSRLTLGGGYIFVSVGTGYKKLSKRTGSELYTYNVGSSVYSIAVDHDQNAYLGIATETFRKIGLVNHTILS